MIRVFSLVLAFGLCLSTAYAGGCLTGACGEDVSFTQRPVSQSVDKNIPAFGVKYDYDEKTVGRPVTITPEKTVWVEISSTDVNRVVCMNGTITDINFSQEKGLIGKNNGREAFLKIQAIEEKGKIKYSTTPVEVYITCGGETYGFIGTPKRIPTKTIYLLDPKKKIDEAKLGSSEIDKAVQEILTTVLKDVVPPSWEPLKGQAVYNLNRFKAFNNRTWKIPGIGILVRDFILSTNLEVSCPLSEEDLLHPKLTKNPIAISIVDHAIQRGKSTRAVIIEKVIGGQP